jgi:hypothetical protein
VSGNAIEITVRISDRVPTFARVREDASSMERSIRDSGERSGGHLERLAEKAKEFAVAAGRGLVTAASGLASVASMAGIAAPAVAGVASALVAVAGTVADLTPIIAFAPALVGGWLLLKAAVISSASAIGEALEPVVTKFQAATVHAQALAQVGIAKVGEEFNKVNMPQVAGFLDQIARTANRAAIEFGGWVNSAPGISLIERVTRLTGNAFEDAAPSITRAAIALGNMAGRANIEGTIRMIGDAVELTARRFAEWADSKSADQINESMSKVERAFGFVIDKIRALVEVIKWLASHEEEVKKFGDAFAVAGIAIGLATGNWVAVIMGAGGLILSHFDEVKAGISKAWEAISNDPSVQGIADAVKDIAKIIKEDFVSAWEAMQPALQKFGEAASEAWDKIGPFVEDFLRNPEVIDGLRTIAAVVGIIVVAFIALGATVTVATGAIVAAIGGLLVWLLGDFVDGVKESVEGFMSAWDYLSELPDRIGEWLSALPERIGEWLSEAANTAAYWAGYAVGWVINAFMELPDKVSEAISSAPDKIAATLKETAAEAKKGATNAVNSLRTALSNAPSAISSALSSAGANVRKAFSGAGSWLTQAGRDVINGLINGIKSMASAAFNAAQGVVSSAIRGATGGLAGKRTGGVIGMAAGGGPRNGLTLVGEDGPELVDLAPGSTVHSNADSQRILADSGGGGGGGRTVIEFVGASDAEQVLVDLLRRIVRVRGGSAEVVFSS